jgi:hypothetical protein
MKGGKKKIMGRKTDKTKGEKEGRGEARKREIKDERKEDKSGGK